MTWNCSEMADAPRSAVTVVLPSIQRRGAEIQGAALAAGLAARGWSVDLVAVAAGTGHRDLDVPVIGAGARSPRTVLALARRIGSSVVIAHGSSALPVVAAAARVRRVRWIYRSIGDPAAWVRGRAHRARTAWMLSGADRVVTLWEQASEEFRELYGVSASRLAVIPNDRRGDEFVPVDSAGREAARQHLGVHGPVVAYLGALAGEKRPGDVVEALSGDDVDIVLAGQGPLAGELSARSTQRARLQVISSGVDPRTVLAAADVVVLPSRTEGMPGVVIEALLSGVPVVASAVGAVPSMIADGRDGFLVAPGDIVGLRAAVRAVLAVPGAMARTSRDRALERYDPTAVLDAWEALLNDLDANGRAPRRAR